MSYWTTEAATGDVIFKILRTVQENVRARVSVQ